MATKIEKLEDIDYTLNDVITMEVSILNIASDGDSERKRPIKFFGKLEHTGENIQLSTWNYDLLDILKDAVQDDCVYELSGKAGNYGNYGEQVRIGSITKLDKRSTKKIIKSVKIDELKREIISIIETYVPKNSIYRGILDEFLINNEKFWVWPAASRIHHNYPGGLAKHSLTVCKHAINFWKTYEGSNCDIQLLVTGSLLHDIGKISEYKQDSSRTKYGHLIPHPVDGFRKIAEYAAKKGLDFDKDTHLIMLSHIIISHHDKLEFGASTRPGILEAVLISKADSLDAGFEASDKVLDTLSHGDISGNIIAIDGAKLFKWKA